MLLSSLKAQTLIRARCQNEAAQAVTIAREKRKGGGLDPTRLAIIYLGNLLYDGFTLRECLAKIRDVDNADLASETEDVFLRAKHVVESLQGRPVERPFGTFSSPSNDFDVIAKPHASIEQGSTLVHVIVLNSKTLDFTRDGAVIGAAIFDKALAPPLLHHQAYVFHDVWSGKQFRLEGVTAAERQLLIDFLLHLENLRRVTELRRIAGRKRQDAKATTSSVSQAS